jgi:hypothetical protein
MCEDKTIRASLDGKVYGLWKCFPGRRVFRIRWCIAQDNFAGDVDRRH